MKSISLVLFSSIALAFVVSGTPYDMDWHRTGSSGAVSTGGPYSMRGGIAHAGSTTVSGGGYSFSGGYRPSAPTSPCAIAQALLAEPDGMTTNRYLSVVPTNAGTQTALRVTFVDLPSDYSIWNDRSMWVTNPRTITEQSGSDSASPSPTFTAAGLSCEQDCRDWGAIEMIDIFGEGVIPGGQYVVQAINCGCTTADESNFSASLPANTSVYGDLVGNFDGTACEWTPANGIVSVPFDTVADIDKFINKPCAPRKARADLVGVPPNRACVDQKINVSDYVETIGAFQGADYPFLPSARDPCSALACPNP